MERYHLGILDRRQFGNQRLVHLGQQVILALSPDLVRMSSCRPSLARIQDPEPRSALERH